MKMSQFQNEKQAHDQSQLEHKSSRRSFLTASASRTIALGLSSVALSAVLQACGGDSGGASDAGQITVWTWPDNDKTFAKTTPIFEKKFPNIKVNVQAFDNASYHDKLLAALVAGSGPDVAMVEIGQVAKFKGKPGFVDLAQEPYNAVQQKASYANFSWNYVADAQTSKLFALPKNTGPGGLFYRRDLFEKAGLATEPEQVQTLLKDWDAFLRVGKQLSIKDKQWMVPTPNQIFGTIRTEAGISYYDEKGNLQIKHEGFKSALQYTQDAWKAGIISPFDEWSAEWSATMQNGTVATYCYGNWFGGLLKDVYARDASGKWGVTFAPAFQGNTAYNNGGDFISILQTSGKKQAAWEYIKFVTQDVDSLKTMYLANDLYPAWSPALKENWLNTSDAYYKGQQVNQIFSQVQARMTPPITNANDPVVNEALNAAIVNVTRGNMRIDSALDQAEQQIKAKTGQ
jgi:ABC-type glycerol-3-phosphate transport system substrate-binding protein